MKLPFTHPLNVIAILPNYQHYLFNRTNVLIIPIFQVLVWRIQALDSKRLPRMSQLQLPGEI